MLFRSIVFNGSAESPIGPVAAHGIADGTRVDVLIRPDGVSLGDPAGTAPATVVSRHLLGADHLVVLRLADSGATLRARVHGSAAPAAGCQVGVAVDPGAVFVFPCARPDSDDA